MGHVERIVPDETEPGIVALHLKRYEWARAWCEGKDVLDAACGVGYGSAHLAGVARRVVGADIDEEALGYARTRYAAPNVEFVRLDLEELPFPGGSFDVVCSFETIEHLDDPARFVRGAAAVLRRDGVLLASTPRAERTTWSPENPHHRVELAPADFEALLRDGFGDVELYGQRRAETQRYRLARRLDALGIRKQTALFRPLARRLLGTPATADLTTGDVVISRDGLERASEVLAVCSSPH